jgi:hypothetical protein
VGPLESLILKLKKRNWTRLVRPVGGYRRQIVTAFKGYSPHILLGFEAGVGSGPSANVRMCAGTCDPPSGGTPVLNEAQDANEFFSKSVKSITSKVLIERFTPLATSTVRVI